MPVRCRKKFGDVHLRNMTPGFGTLVTGAVSVVWYLVLAYIPNADILTDLGHRDRVRYCLLLRVTNCSSAGAIDDRRELKQEPA